MLQIDDDIYQKKREKLEAIFKEVQEKHGAKNAESITRAGLRGAQQMEELVMKNSVEELQKAQRELANKGASQAVLDGMEKQILKRVELEEMKKALMKAGLTANDLKGKTIEMAYNDYLKGMTDKSAMKDLKAEVTHNIETAQQKALAGALSESQKQENKLTKLQAAAELADQIEKLKDIPQRLENLQATLKNISVERTGKTIKKLFKKVSKIADDMVTASQSKEMQSLQNVKTEGFDKIVQVTDLVNKSIAGIQSVLKKALYMPSHRAIKWRMKKADIAVQEMILFVQKVANYAYNLPPGATEAVGSLAQIMGDINHAMTLKHLNNPKIAANVVKSIQTMNGLLTPAAATVTGIQAFSGGDLSVTHNLPKTKINVTVNMDAKKMGQTMGKVNCTKDNASGMTYMSWGQSIEPMI